MMQSQKTYAALKQVDKIKMNSKRGLEMIWSAVILGLVAVIVGLVILSIVSPGLFKQSKNVAYLSSCKTQNGECRSSCNPDEIGFFKLSCPSDLNDDGSIDAEGKKKEYCCIKKSKG